MRRKTWKVKIVTNSGVESHKYIVADNLVDAVNDAVNHHDVKPAEIENISLHGYIDLA